MCASLAACVCASAYTLDIVLRDTKEILLLLANLSLSESGGYEILPRCIPPPTASLHAVWPLTF